MTKIKFYKEKENLIGFEISGHAGKVEEGKNIVCAAISTASQMAVIGLQEELKLKPEVKMSDGYLKVIMKEDEIDKNGVQLILKTCFDTLKSIADEYKKIVKVEVVENV